MHLDFHLGGEQLNPQHPDPHPAAASPAVLVETDFKKPSVSWVLEVYTLGAVNWGLGPQSVFLLPTTLFWHFRGCPGHFIRTL